MLHLRRPAVYVPIVLAVLGLFVGVYALATRGGGSSLSAGRGNCPPVARDDAAVTKPSEPVKVDVLANDSDVDGDTLTFKVIGVSAGSAEVDSSGDRQTFVFTPSGPNGSIATATYRVSDPAGDVSTATVSIAVAADGVLPLSMRTASVGETNGDVVEAHCTRVAKQEDAPRSTSATTAAPESASSEEATDTTAAPRRTTTTRSGTVTVDAGPSYDDDSGGTIDVGDAGPSPSPTQPPATAPPNQNDDDPPCYDAQSCRDYANGKGTTTTAP